MHTINKFKKAKVSATLFTCSHHIIGQLRELAWSKCLAESGNWWKSKSGPWTVANCKRLQFSQQFPHYDFLQTQITMVPVSSCLKLVQDRHDNSLQKKITSASRKYKDETLWHEVLKSQRVMSANITEFDSVLFPRAPVSAHGRLSW